jgi:putative membrane protein
MVQDHSQANDKLMQLASSLGIHVRPAPNAEQRANIARLSRLSGRTFDRAYAKDMVEDHVKDVGEFKEAASSADMRAVRAFARETVPTLQSHLEHARGLEQQVENGGSMQRMEGHGHQQYQGGYQQYQGGYNAGGACCTNSGSWY